MSAPSQPGMGMWTEHRNPEGRTYWYNTGTKASVWEKPDDLKTPFERALNQTKWKEYFSGGRKYYYNTETKDSKWDMPDELLLILEKVEKESQNNTQPTVGPAQITAPGFTPVGSTQGALVPMGGTDSSSSNPTSQPNGQNGVDLSVGPHTGALPSTSTGILPARPNLPDDPVIPHNGFLTVEEGEKAFMHLLRKAGVDATWTWDQTMRAIITDPLYKALNTLAEKKAAWEKFTTTLKAKEQEEKEARLAKLRPAIRNMLKGNPSVFHYTTFGTADKLFSQHPIWQQARIESERRFIFEEYVAELKSRDVQESRAARARSVAKVVNLFKQLNVDVLTRWRIAHDLVLGSQEWNDDSELRKLPTLDILLAFEDYSRVREREYEDQMRKAQVEKTRRERKARESFKELLQNLVHAGKIKARSKWKEVYPIFAQDERYLSMLGNPGSNPLELFWDAVDVLDQELDRKIAVIEAAFERHNAKEAQRKGVDVDKDAGFAVGPDTTEEGFRSIVKANADGAVNELSKEDLAEIFTTLHAAALKKQSEEKRRAERKQRHLQDDLRYALKKLPEPLDINMAFEEVVPLIQHLPEYIAVDDDEGRRAAFAKFVKRQKVSRLSILALFLSRGCRNVNGRRHPKMGPPQQAASARSLCANTEIAIGTGTETGANVSVKRTGTGNLIIVIVKGSEIVEKTMTESRIMIANHEERNTTGMMSMTTARRETMVGAIVTKTMIRSTGIIETTTEGRTGILAMTGGTAKIGMRAQASRGSGNVVRLCIRRMQSGMRIGCKMIALKSERDMTAKSHREVNELKLPKRVKSDQCRILLLFFSLLYAFIVSSRSRSISNYIITYKDGACGASL
ncbi:hypothetical protein H2248_010696 [Termitomyces sp. 'cryptogamus']|nr:hypothetical protein H2248_010696 [Termitomyces sp. 'cryptogamus']